MPAEDFVPSQSLEDQFIELERRYNVLESAFDRILDAFNDVLNSNQELQNASRVLCTDVTELIAAIKAGKP